MLKARDIMTEEVITISPEADVEKAARILSEHSVSGLPVVDDDNHLVGIVSERDLIVKDKKLEFPDFISILGGYIYLESHRKFEEEFKKYIAVKIKDLMTTEVMTIGPETPVHEIAGIMTDKGVNRLPVVDGGELVGIVTRADLVSHIAREE